MATHNTLIIIPAYNEEKRILKALREYSRTGFDILVVFDGTDNTDKIVIEFSKNYSTYLLKFNKRLGKGGAIIEGIKWALKNKYKYVIIADADASTNYYFIKKIRKLLEKFDFVYTIRTLYDYPILRRVFSKLYLVYNWFLLPELLFIVDLQSGYKGFNRKFVKIFANHSIVTGFAFDSNLFLIAKHYKLKMGKIKILWEYDKLSVFSKKMLKHIIRMALSIIKLRIYFSPFRFILKYTKPLETKLRILLQ